MIVQIKQLYTRHGHYGFCLRTTLISSINCFFSTLNTHPKHQFADNLVRSCGFSPEQAIKVAKKVPFLDSIPNLESVLQFFRQNNLTDAHIRTALARDPRVLSLNVKRTLNPMITELEEFGFTASHILQLFSLNALVFKYSSLHEKIKFWIQILGSVDNLFNLVKKNPEILTSNLKKVILPNLSFLQENCGLSGTQIIQMSSSWLLTENPKKIKEIVQRAKSLGIPCKSGRFKDALLSSAQNLTQIEKKIQLFKGFGWSNEEINSMIKKQPRLLRNSSEKLKSTVNFLIKEVGLNSSFVKKHPVILMLSLEKRLMPRHFVMKILDSYYLPEGKRSFYCAVFLTEKKFLEKFVLPNEKIIPSLSTIYSLARGVNEKNNFDKETNLLEKLGFSKSEIKFMINKLPNYLFKSEEKIGRINDFLINECHLNLSYIARHPRILTCNLERRLIPRNNVMKSLEIHGLVKKRSFLNIVKMNEINFVKKYVKPFEDMIHGLAETYFAASCSRKILKQGGQ